VISIQTAMLVGLGFLLASLLAVLLTPAYRARTVRLTTNHVRAQLPTTEQELNADKDRIRADNALRVHKLETKLEQFKFSAARQLVEVSRRDGLINTLNGDLDSVKTDLEAAQNARNVLEQTIADRLPRVEQRLIEAKKLLFQRDREIASLTEDAGRTQRALVEAVQINTQQRAELERLHMVLDTRAAQNRDSLSDPTFDAELALRAEIEALRTRSHDQSSLIERLQGADREAAPEATLSAEPGAAGDLGPAVPEVVRLQRDLVRAETALKSIKDVASAGHADRSKAELELRNRDQKIEEQVQQIAGLEAALRAYQEESAGDRPNSIKDSKIAMKSRISSLTAQSEAQGEAIRKLRAEVAASNERLARQAQHFMEEMRRLGAGTLPASAQVRRPASNAVRRTLTQKITEAKPELAAASYGASWPMLVKSDATKPEPPAPADSASNAAASRQEPSPSKHKAVVVAPVTQLTPPADPAIADASGTAEVDAAHVPSDAAALDVNGATQAVAANDTDAPPRPAPLQRTRLLDRINDYGKG
jgi:hypothetical protein